MIVGTDERPSGQCVGGKPKPDGSPGNAGGSGTAICLSGRCVGTGSQCAVNCDDGNSSTIDFCDNGVCRHEANPDNQFCESRPDGSLCGVCRTGPSATRAAVCRLRLNPCPLAQHSPSAISHRERSSIIASRICRQIWRARGGSSVRSRVMPGFMCGGAPCPAFRWSAHAGGLFLIPAGNGRQPCPATTT